MATLHSIKREDNDDDGSRNFMRLTESTQAFQEVEFYSSWRK